MTTSQPILCGLCDAPIDFRDKSDPAGQAGCAACDNWADQDEIRQMVADYAKDEGQMILNRALRDTARGSKLMHFTGQTQSDKRHRFRIDLQL